MFSSFIFSVFQNVDPALTSLFGIPQKVASGDWKLPMAVQPIPCYHNLGFPCGKNPEEMKTCRLWIIPQQQNHASPPLRRIERHVGNSYLPLILPFPVLTPNPCFLYCFNVLLCHWISLASPRHPFPAPHCNLGGGAKTAQHGPGIPESLRNNQMCFQISTQANLLRIIEHEKGCLSVSNNVSKVSVSIDWN